MTEIWSKNVRCSSKMKPRLRADWVVLSEELYILTSCFLSNGFLVTALFSLTFCLFSPSYDGFYKWRPSVGFLSDARVRAFCIVSYRNTVCRRFRTKPAAAAATDARRDDTTVVMEMSESRAGKSDVVRRRSSSNASSHRISRRGEDTPR